MEARGDSLPKTGEVTAEDGDSDRSFQGEAEGQVYTLDRSNEFRVPSKQQTLRRKYRPVLTRDPGYGTTIVGVSSHILMLDERYDREM
jgi:hypothetical protein